MGLERIAPFAPDPITLAEAKLHLRQDETADDALIGTLIKAARDHVENLTGRSLVTQGWRLRRDTFPSYDGAIRLGRAPVIAVQSVKFYDTAEVEQTLASSEYIVDVGSTWGEIALGYGRSWPASLWRRNAVTIDFTAGYGPNASDVPAALIAAMKLVIGDLYANREAQVVGTTVSANPAVDRLLGPYTLPLVA